MLRMCKHHGLTEHSRVGSEKHLRCRQCLKEAVQRRREKLKSMAIEYCGGVCNICGYSKCSAALEFHHIDQENKDFGIANKGYTRSWEKIKIELDKCIMLCANCHREIHAGLIQV